MYLEMPKEKDSKGECNRKKVRARKCNITSSSAADNKRAAVREAEVVQRQLTQKKLTNWDKYNISSFYEMEFT